MKNNTKPWHGLGKIKKVEDLEWGTEGEDHQWGGGGGGGSQKGVSK